MREDGGRRELTHQIVHHAHELVVLEILHPEQRSGVRKRTSQPEFRPRDGLLLFEVRGGGNADHRHHDARPGLAQMGKGAADAQLQVVRMGSNREDGLPAYLSRIWD